MLEPQLVGQILWGVIGLMAAIAGIGLIGAFVSLGRSAYRKE